MRGRPRFRVRRVYGLGAGAPAGAPASRRRPAVSMTRIAVFAYSDTGHACLKHLLERGERVVFVATHRDRPDEARWFPSVAELARAHGIEPVIMENPLDPQAIVRLRVARAGPALLLLLPPHPSDEMLAEPPLGRVQHARLAPAAVPRPRAGQLGGR